VQGAAIAVIAATNRLQSLGAGGLPLGTGTAVV